MAAETMTNENVSVTPKEGPIDITKGTTMYAPKGADFHRENDEVIVADALVAHFESKGYSRTKKK